MSLQPTTPIHQIALASLRKAWTLWVAPKGSTRLRKNFTCPILGSKTLMHAKSCPRLLNATCLYALARSNVLTSNFAAEAFREQVDMEAQNAMMAARFQHFFFHRSRPQKDLVPCPPCPCCYSQWVVVGADPCRSLAPADPFIDLEAADSWQCLETVLYCKTVHACVW